MCNQQTDWHLKQNSRYCDFFTLNLSLFYIFIFSWCSSLCINIILCTRLCSGFTRHSVFPNCLLSYDQSSWTVNTFLPVPSAFAHHLDGNVERFRDCQSFDVIVSIIVDYTSLNALCFITYITIDVLKDVTDNMVNLSLAVNNFILQFKNIFYT